MHVQRDLWVKRSKAQMHHTNAPHSRARVAHKQRDRPDAPPAERGSKAGLPAHLALTKRTPGGDGFEAIARESARKSFNQGS